MRIQNNITAMNTHRQYTINNDNVAKNAEKLSSGYRINRAGDDAAGLAISEKMRSQIRGLNMATKNSQDAISLVQTAEGALQETHAMLQRMNELAVQAATGTNESLDRNALAKEFEQLKREINDVAEQTNFNNMTILDGSLSYEGYQRSAATAGVTKTVGTDLAGSGSANSAGAFTELQATSGVDAIAAPTTTTGTLGQMTIDLTGANGTNYSDGDTVEMKLTVNGKEVTLTGTASFSGSSSAYAAGDIAKALVGTSGVSFTDKDGYTYKITQGTGEQLKIAVDTTTGKGANKDGASLVLTGNASVDSMSGPAKATMTVDSNHINERENVQASSLNQIDLSKVKEGDTITIGDKTFEFVTAGAKDKDGADITASGASITESGNVAVLWDGKTDNSSNLVDQLETAVSHGTNGATGVTIDAKGAGVFELKANASTHATNAGADGKASNDLIKTTYTPAGGEEAAGATTSSAKTTVEFDFAKLKVGDTVSLTIGGEEVTVTKDAKDDRASFMKKLENIVGADNESGIAGAKVNGNAIVVEGGISVSDIEFESGDLQKTNGLRIQVGAEENQQLTLAIDAMNTKALNLDDATLFIQGASTDDSIDAAGRAITATRNAINKVSDQRATLGAMQNRLDHKIANLKVTSENLSAAESRIRDVDMASEMTSFTKNNILSQAATAMLAQANSLPQNVLSLLG